MEAQTPKTLFDKIWQRHVVEQRTDYPDLLYIDHHFIHEVTSPQAFDGLRKRGLPVFRPGRVTATADHNVPTINQHLPIAETLSRHQVDTLKKNCREFGVELYGLGHEKQGIVHVIGPELGLTQPGMTIVCGDSHTSTHGAFGAIAFGIGTSQVEQVLATQCLLQYKPKTMKIEISGTLSKGVGAKDIILYVISQISSSGGTGYFVEYTGSAIRSLSMEARMTICNMSIEMGARGGMIAPDDTTFAYLKGREHVPKGEAWQRAVEVWKELPSDTGATYDAGYNFRAEDIEPWITYGTNPGMGTGVSKPIPEVAASATANDMKKALRYMDLKPRQSLLGKKIDYVFIGSCTNSRIEDLREVASFIKGKKKAAGVNVWIVPGSKKVEAQAKAEGLDTIFAGAGFELRQPGCSACLAMNEDKVPARKYCVSTSNRNFEGRQGPGSRTFLASPLTAAAAAVTGEICDVRGLVDG
ncbi:MAG: 3-isopropylmalate dehydratase large subunit [Saprospiraceae bacterium]